MESTRELLHRAAGSLREAGVPTPEVDAELLLAHVTGRQRALLRMAGSSVSPEDSAVFAGLVSSRARRIPLQHLTGLAPFRHLELRVGPGVFIPRPETELMVDHVLGFLEERHSEKQERGIPAQEPDTATPASGTPATGSGRAGTLGATRQGVPGAVVVDLCTGSAALALSIATEVPGSRVVAVELAPSALEWARVNLAGQAAAVAAADSTVEIVAADATVVAGPGGVLEPLRGWVDIVVTNPPYVPDGAVPREAEVRDHDPGLALYGGPDGLDVVRQLAVQAALLLRPGGLLVVEHADVQGEAAGESGVPGVLRAADGASWTAVTDHLDFAGRPRHTSARRAPDGGRP